jgi:hypothetical protein
VRFDLSLWLGEFAVQRDFNAGLPPSFHARLIGA